MIVKVGDQEVDAACLLFALFERAKSVNEKPRVMSREEAERLVDGNLHFDWDWLYDRRLRLGLEHATSQVRRPDLYDEVNGSGLFAQAVAAALTLRSEWDEADRRTEEMRQNLLGQG